jgi:hypothetical protein
MLSGELSAGKCANDYPILYMMLESTKNTLRYSQKYNHLIINKMSTNQPIII